MKNIPAKLRIMAEAGGGEGERFRVPALAGRCSLESAVSVVRMPMARGQFQTCLAKLLVSAPGEEAASLGFKAISQRTACEG